MKRVILCLNDNPIYTGFWPLAARVWSKFGVAPALAFVGDHSRASELKLFDHGEVIVLPETSVVKRSSTRDWRVTWGLFHVATRFADDLCMTHGIDQIPLSRYFEKVFAAAESDYVVGLADGYGRKDHFPSSHHCTHGKTFARIFPEALDWEAGLKSVESFGLRESAAGNRDLDHKDLWGIDEVYTSKRLTSCEGVNLSLGLGKGFVFPRRIDRSGHLAFDGDKMKRGWYSELHCPRPFEQYAKKITSITDAINHD